MFRSTLAWLRNLSTTTTEERYKYSGYTEQVGQDASHSREISRLLTAALVNHKFSDLLLTDARAALTTGYNGESFQLSPEETRLVLSIQASSLHDFASQLVTKTTIAESLLGQEVDDSELAERMHKVHITQQYVFGN